MPGKISHPLEVTRLEVTRLEQSLECNVQGKYIDIGSVLFNEFSTKCLGVLAVSSLFPYGQEDPTSNETTCGIRSK